MVQEATFSLTVITPERPHEPRVIKSLSFKGDGGRLTILAGHQPLVCSMPAGDVMVGMPDGRNEAWHIEAGVLQVDADHSVSLLVPEVDYEAVPHA